MPNTITETYSRGDRRFAAAPAHHSEIYDMNEKEGYVAKEIEITQEAIETYGDFEKIKSLIQEWSALLDKHYGNSLPNYYFTFVQRPPQNKIIFFMEEVKSLNQGTVPPQELDSLLEKAKKCMKPPITSKSSWAKQLI